MTPFSPALPLDALLSASAALPEFKADVLAYAAFQRGDRVVVKGHAPRVKVLRVLCQLLHAEPSLRVESIRVSGVSGCSDFRGQLEATIDGEERVWEFEWDCRWRAREADLVDTFGYPDQVRAAREYGWRCFSAWERRDVTTGSVVLTG